jgi:hypothetical protein
MGVIADLLMPPAPHQQVVLAAAHQVPAVAGALIDGLYNPRSLFPWFVDPAFTREFLQDRGTPPGVLEQEPALP